ncbi:MAG TPA: type II toxin-antitoxin system VapC family toxin [Longimicrobiales bacterium]|nr:type II toxin-antitoxin system VapC family toxin [Longimicrobiales bacterium]
MIALDTSVLVEALGAGGAMRGPFREALAASHRIVIPTLVLYEWLRGPRGPEELAVQEAVLPAAEALPFGPEEARTAAALYRRVGRPRGREIDLAIAACAIVWDATIWTLNRADFEDIPGVRLFG